MTRVLVVAAHPDDELLGLGATVARHVEAGDEVTAVIVSEGATSRYAEGADRALRDAAHAAAAVLGVRDLRFLGMEDQRLDARHRRSRSLGRGGRADRGRESPRDHGAPARPCPVREGRHHVPVKRA